jgi:hypothetical protein
MKMRGIVVETGVASDARKCYYNLDDGYAGVSSRTRTEARAKSGRNARWYMLAPIFSKYVHSSLILLSRWRIASVATTAETEIAGGSPTSS